jgi:hypothetical protein
MQTLTIYARENVSVKDMFGELFARVERWAVEFFAKLYDNSEEDEPHEEDGSTVSGTDPPALGISVNDGVATNDLFGN